MFVIFSVNMKYLGVLHQMYKRGTGMLGDTRNQVLRKWVPVIGLEMSSLYFSNDQSI